MSKCKYLPDEDKKFLSRARNVDMDETESASDNDDDSQESDDTSVRHIKTTPNVKKWRYFPHHSLTHFMNLILSE